jgi:hypothetical protein
MTLMEQIDVVVNAPIPFFIVLVTVCGVAVVAIWRAFEWRYAAVLEKTRTLFDLAGQETEIVKRREAELNEVVKKQTNGQFKFDRAWESQHRCPRYGDARF